MPLDRLTACLTRALGLTFTFALTFIFVGCNSHALVAVPPAPEVQTDVRFTVEPESKLDLLFLVDNSQSMAEEQGSLARNFPLLMQALEQQGPLDLRLAVVSSDVGAGGGAPRSPCRALGDEGTFQAAARCGLDPGATFLSVDRQGTKNFQGTLADTFACIADLGVRGCGFEHQLQAVRFALYRKPQAETFLRPDAHLGIVLVTDEDDCSAEPDATLFGDDRPGQDPNLRCATAGHVCGDREVPAAPFSAALASCRPVEHAADPESRRTRLINVSELAAHIKALKAGTDRQIIVSAIMGWDDSAGATYRVAGGDNGLAVAPTCQGAGGIWATPGVRIRKFVESFEQSSLHSICAPDLREAITRIGERLRDGIADGACLPPLLKDTDLDTPDLQPDCLVGTRPPGAGETAEQLVPACTTGASPCWEITDRPSCPARRFLSIKGASRSERHVRRVSCATCTTAGDPACAPSG